MALVQYETYLFYPGGGFATDEDVTVREQGSNVVPNLFTDSGGTTPKSPVSTDEDGLLSFYAVPGLYEAVFAGGSFGIPVAESEVTEVRPGRYVHTQETPSTQWTINHHFGFPPLVDVLVGNASLRDYEVTHPSTATTVIVFETQTSGVAHLRR